MCLGEKGEHAYWWAIPVTITSLLLSPKYLFAPFPLITYIFICQGSFPKPHGNFTFCWKAGFVGDAEWSSSEANGRCTGSESQRFSEVLLQAFPVGSVPDHCNKVIFLHQFVKHVTPVKCNKTRHTCRHWGRNLSAPVHRSARVILHSRRNLFVHCYPWP